MNDGLALVEHGGKLRAAAQHYGIPLADWVDLSTGINPHGWPLPAIPAAAWARLPEDEDELVAVAKAFYGAPDLLPVAGSQAAIQTLPQLRCHSRVAILSPAYAEHEHAWRKAGHEVVPVAPAQVAEVVPEVDVVLLVNPNNPTGHTFDADQLLQWRTELAARGGWLIVDEAFMDVTPARSIAAHTDQAGLIVLRSLGKFFGLAGARVGFVLAPSALLQQMRALLGPWSVAGPSRYVALAALADADWHAHMRQQLPQHSARLAALLTQHGLAPSGGTALFQSVVIDGADSLHEQLARQGIFTRRFSDAPRVRFGLPGDESQWQCLDSALARVSL